MDPRYSQLLALGISVAWLAAGQRADAQGSSIYHTVLANPNPGGIFGDDGIPVYTTGGGGPFSLLSVDLNHDGTEDYRVVATGTVTWGFQMEGVGVNAVWSHPTGGLDIGAPIVPLAFGTGIGATLPGGDEWRLTETTPFGINGPYFSSYSSIGSLGLFVDQTAYAGLQFYIGSELHYGWIKVQELPWLGGGGIVFEYAYDTRQNMPIMAGAVPEPGTISLFCFSCLMLWLLRKNCFFRDVSTRK